MSTEHPFADALAYLRARLEHEQIMLNVSFGDEVAQHEKAVTALGLAIEAVERAGLIVCSYCGSERPKTDRDGMLEHILTCDKRPEARLTQAMLDALVRIEAAILEEIADAYSNGHNMGLAAPGASRAAVASTAEHYASTCMDRIKAAGALSFGEGKPDARFVEERDTAIRITRELLAWSDTVLSPAVDEEARVALEHLIRLAKSHPTPITPEQTTT